VINLALLTKYYYKGRQVKNVVGGARGTDVGQKCTRGSGRRGDPKRIPLGRPKIRWDETAWRGFI